jgi:hypothetical protein
MIFSCTADYNPDKLYGAMLPVGCKVPINLASNTDNKLVIPKAGTLSLLTVQMDESVSIGTFELTVYQNSSATTLVVDVPPSDGTGQDTTHTVTVAVGDLIYYIITQASDINAFTASMVYTPS